MSSTDHSLCFDVVVDDTTADALVVLPSSTKNIYSFTNLIGLNSIKRVQSINSANLLTV